MKKDYYTLLGVEPNADLKIIKSAYRKLAAKFHPDKNSSNNKKRFGEITNAYNILKDETSRANYDKQRAYCDSINKSKENKASKKEDAEQSEVQRKSRQQRDTEAEGRRTEARAKSYEAGKQRREERKRYDKIEAERVKLERKTLNNFIIGAVCIVFFTVFFIVCGSILFIYVIAVNKNQPNKNLMFATPAPAITLTPIPARSVKSNPAPSANVKPSPIFNKIILCPDGESVVLAKGYTKAKIQLHKNCWIKVEFDDRRSFYETVADYSVEYYVMCSNKNTANSSTLGGEPRFTKKLFSGYMQAYQYMNCIKPVYFKAANKPFSLEIREFPPRTFLNR